MSQGITLLKSNSPTFRRIPITLYTLRNRLSSSICKTLLYSFANASQADELIFVFHSHPNILKGILALNFRKPSKIQERALPLLLANPPTNMIGQSQSGTGKTAAFVLNILHRLQLETEQQRKTPQALVLAPTRELARQIVDVVGLMGRFIEGLVVEAEVPAEEKRKGPVQASVIVGTPGTVVDHLRKRLIDSRNIGVLVLDEADNMVDAGGHGDQCLRVKS